MSFWNGIVLGYVIAILTVVIVNACDAKADPVPSVTFQWERSDDPRIEGEHATIRKIAPRHVQLCLRSVTEGFESSGLSCSETIPLPEPTDEALLGAGVAMLMILRRWGG
jgi:hypothetical protein